MQSDRLMAILKSIIDDEGGKDENPNTASFGPLLPYFSGAHQTWTTKVLDPKTIIPKGGLSKDRLKPFEETLKRKKPKHKLVFTSFCLNSFSLLCSAICM